MNKANVQKTINIMERLKSRGNKINMGLWQEMYTSIPHKTEHSMIDVDACGCVGGWIAVSEEWHADGGSVICLGIPYMNNHAGSGAIELWLGISRSETDNLLCIGDDDGDDMSFSVLYGKNGIDVTVDDVLIVLYRLLETGTVWLTHEKVDVINQR